MTMSRKHYRLLANALGENHVPGAALRSITARVSSALASDNPRFDRAVFAAAVEKAHADYLAGLAPGTSNDQVVTAKVSILTNGETVITAPDGVAVEVSWDLADGDRHCRCGSVIRRYGDDYRAYETGEWFHLEAPYFWGDDHDAKPEE